MEDYIVMVMPSSYNIIVRRLLLWSLKEKHSTYYL